MKFFSPTRLLTRAVLPIAMAIVLVPMILNYGMGYISTVDRIGNGEDVSSQEILGAGTQGIPLGETQEQAEKVLGTNSVSVPSKNAGETCRGYELAQTKQHLVLCYAKRETSAGPRMVVTSSRIDIGKLG